MDEDAVREVLAGIEDPDLGDDIVSLGLVGDVTVAGDEVTVEVALEAPGSPVEAELSDSIVEALEAEGLSVTLTTADDDTDDAIGVESLGPDA